MNTNVSKANMLSLQGQNKFRQTLVVGRFGGHKIGNSWMGESGQIMTPHPSTFLSSHSNIALTLIVDHLAHVANMNDDNSAYGKTSRRHIQNILEFKTRYCFVHKSINMYTTNAMNIQKMIVRKSDTPTLIINCLEISDQQNLYVICSKMSKLGIVFACPWVLVQLTAMLHPNHSGKSLLKF